MVLIKLFKSNKGSSLIFFTILLMVIAGMGGLVIDVGNVSIERQNLQKAIDAATLAASQELPDTTAARTVANNYLQLNGCDPTATTITFSSNDTKINIRGNKQIDFLFAKVLGFTSTNAVCNAAAVSETIGQAFNYVLLSGSTSSSLTINGSNSNVNGNTHTNYNFVANGSKQTITGACEAVNTITVNGSQMNIPNRVPNAPFVPMPDFSETIRLQALAAGTLYNTSQSYNGSSINVNNPIYVNGDLTINGSHFKGKGCILATGNITFNGSNLYETSSDAICFYSKTGNITINGSNANLSGIVYAPSGTITMNGSNQTVNGRVIGNILKFNGSGFTVNGSTNDIKSLPPSSAKLTK